MAVKRTAQKRRAPARSATKPKVRTRTITKYKTRYRNPAGSVRSRQIKSGVENGIYNGVGFAGVRTMSNMIMPAASGYQRAGVDAAVGLGAGMIANGLKAEPKVVAGLITGAITSAVIRILDMLSGGKYLQLGETGMGYYERSLSGYNRVPGVSPLIPLPLPAPIAIEGVRDNVMMTGIGRAPWSG